MCCGQPLWNLRETKRVLLRVVEAVVRARLRVFADLMNGHGLNVCLGQRLACPSVRDEIAGTADKGKLCLRKSCCSCCIVKWQIHE